MYPSVRLTLTVPRHVILNLEKCGRIDYLIAAENFVTGKIFMRRYVYSLYICDCKCMFVCYVYIPPACLG